MTAEIFTMVEGREKRNRELLPGQYIDGKGSVGSAAVEPVRVTALEQGKGMDVQRILTHGVVHNVNKELDTESIEHHDAGGAAYNLFAARGVGKPTEFHIYPH